MGLLMSIVIHEVLTNKKMDEAGQKIRHWLKPVALFSLIVLISINLYNYFSTLNHRTYVIRDLNAYFAETLDPDDIVLGAWGPSLTWDCKSRAYPVWNHFLNFKDPINTFKPRVVLTETDEQDAEQTYKSQGINLAVLADSTRTVRIGQWDVVIYWMR
jgi:hypothetical protein